MAIDCAAATKIIVRFVHNALRESGFKTAKG